MVLRRIGWLRLTVRTYSPFRSRICSTLHRWTWSASAVHHPRRSPGSGRLFFACCAALHRGYLLFPVFILDDDAFSWVSAENKRPPRCSSGTSVSRRPAPPGLRGDPRHHFPWSQVPTRLIGIDSLTVRRIVASLGGPAARSPWRRALTGPRRGAGDIIGDRPEAAGAAVVAAAPIVKTDAIWGGCPASARVAEPPSASIPPPASSRVITSATLLRSAAGGETSRTRCRSRRECSRDIHTRLGVLLPRGRPGTGVPGRVGECLHREHPVPINSQVVPTQAGQHPGEDRGGKVGSLARGQHTKPLIVRDMLQPRVLLLTRPPQKLIPRATGQHRGPEPDHRDPLTIEHRDITQNLTGQPMPEPVMLGQGSVETLDLIPEDRPHHHIRHTRPSHPRCLPARTRKRQSQRVSAPPSHDHKTLTQPCPQGRSLPQPFK